MGKRQRNHGKKPEIKIDEQDLDRFAGSSDEEDDEERIASSKEPVQGTADDEDDEEENSIQQEKQRNDENSESEKEVESDDDDKEEDGTSVESADSEENLNPAEKMANAMAKILGHGGSTAKSGSVVLAKTVTPLQRLQKQEKEQALEQKQKRKVIKERNLAALHIPLSVATTSTIGQGKPSISKELERERLHRRVATRGVVALFNAITQHQHAKETDDAPKKKTETPKLTKHGFLEKIKQAAIPEGKTEEEKKAVSTTKAKSGAGWVQDDFMLKPKKNWDEESSEEERDLSEDAADDSEPEANKRRKVSPVE